MLQTFFHVIACNHHSSSDKKFMCPILFYVDLICWETAIFSFSFTQPSGEDSELFKTKAAEFLLHWGAFSGLLMRELTLQNAQSFGKSKYVAWCVGPWNFSASMIIKRRKCVKYKTQSQQVKVVVYPFNNWYALIDFEFTWQIGSPGRNDLSYTIFF